MRAWSSSSASSATLWRAVTACTAGGRAWWTSTRPQTASSAGTLYSTFQAVSSQTTATRGSSCARCWRRRARCAAQGRNVGVVWATRVCSPLTLVLCVMAAAHRSGPRWPGGREAAAPVGGGRPRGEHISGRHGRVHSVRVTARERSYPPPYRLPRPTLTLTRIFAALCAPATAPFASTAPPSSAAPPASGSPRTAPSRSRPPPPSGGGTPTTWTRASPASPSSARGSRTQQQVCAAHPQEERGALPSPHSPPQRSTGSSPARRSWSPAGATPRWTPSWAAGYRTSQPRKQRVSRPARHSRVVVVGVVLLSTPSLQRAPLAASLPPDTPPTSSGDRRRGCPPSTSLSWRSRHMAPALPASGWRTWSGATTPREVGAALRTGHQKEGGGGGRGDCCMTLWAVASAPAWAASTAATTCFGRWTWWRARPAKGAWTRTAAAFGATLAQRSAGSGPGLTTARPHRFRAQVGAYGAAHRAGARGEALRCGGRGCGQRCKPDRGEGRRG